MSQQFRSFIPNALTLLNLFCGAVAIFFLFQDKLLISCILMCFSLTCDFLDGFAARLLNVQSAIGKQLDSLADMVTFGLLPGFAMFQLIRESSPLSMWENPTMELVVSAIALTITLFSALRLAKFNIDTRQSDHFIGLPTPANAMLIMGIALSMEYDRYHITPTLNNTWYLIGVTLISSWLLVAEFPMIALKFKNFKLKDNQPQFTLIASSLILIFILGILGIPMIIALYVILSLSQRSKFPTH